MQKKMSELETIQLEEKLLTARKIQLLTPELTDLNILSLLYVWYKEYNNQRNCPSRDDSVMQRRKFIIIAITLYSPITLTGGKLVTGLRDKLTEVLELRSPSIISNLSSDMLFYYHQYTSFRRDVTNIYYHLIEKLEWYKKQQEITFQ